MNTIKNFFVDKEQEKISWLTLGEEISIIIPNIDQAILSNNSLILSLTGTDIYPELLVGYNIKGKEIFKTEAPKGFIFSYFTTHPDIGISVVCGADEKINSWYDWHFSIDKVTGKLKRYCPAR